MRCASLEANVRSKGRTEIVVSAMIEIDFIADIEPNTDRPDMALQAAAWIKRAHDVVIPEILDIAEEGTNGRRRAAEMSIQETAFDGYEWMKIGMPESNLRPEQSVQ